MMWSGERRVSCALEAVDLGFGHAGAEEGIFAGAFHDAAPAGIAGDVDHGSEGPVDAGGAGFAGGHGLRVLGGRGVPTGGHGDGDGVDGAEAVDDVEAEEERNVEAALLDGDVLEAIDFGGVGEEEEGADGAGAHHRIHRGAWLAEDRDLGHLAEFFGEGHLGDELVGELAGLGVGGRGGDGLGDLVCRYRVPRS